MERKGEKSERERCIVGVKHPLELSKNYRDTEKEEDKKHRKLKTQRKRQQKRQKRWRKYGDRRQIGMWEYDLYFIQVLNHT